MTIENVKTVMRMMTERRDHWSNRLEIEREKGNDLLVGEALGRTEAYDTCAHFLELLIENDWESLNQYVHNLFTIYLLTNHSSSAIISLQNKKGIKRNEVSYY